MVGRPDNVLKRRAALRLDRPLQRPAVQLRRRVAVERRTAATTRLRGNTCARAFQTERFAVLLGLAPQFFAARAGKPVRALFKHLADRAVVVRRLLPDNRQAAYIARRNEHGLAYLGAACGKLSADKAAEAVPHRVNSVLVIG